MKKLLTLFLFLAWFPLGSNGQGIFNFYNPTAPTRLGSINGPLAGQGIWGMALVGLTTNSLTPLGVALEHRANGVVPPEPLEVPGVFAFGTVEVQMAVWDGALWGTTFASVPANQIGYTDITLITLGTPTGLWEVPRFTQSAIVPVIPEPSARILAVLGGAVLFWNFRIRHRDWRTK